MTVDHQRADSLPPTDSDTHILCRICRRWYRAITYSHLRYVHGILEPQEYKDEFAVAKITAPEVRGRLAEMKTLVRKSDLEYLKRNWGKEPLKLMTRRLGRDASTLRAQARRLGLPLKVESWNAEKVMKLIRRARREGRPLHSGGVRKHNPGLYKAGRYHFGSWRAAVTAAGIAYASVTLRAPFESWSRERIVKEIRALLRSGATIKYPLLEQRHSKLYAAARNHFGNWSAALYAAERSS